MSKPKGAQPQTTNTLPGRLSRLRLLAVSLLVVLASIASIVYVTVHWMERQVLTVDNWVTLVSPLPKSPIVSTALGAHISDQIFESANVERRVSEALPPKASFLAGPLADQLRSLATKAAQQLVASDGFQSVWTTANRIAMNRLVSTARGQPTPLQERVSQKFNLDLSATNGQLGTALGKASAAIPGLQSTGATVVNVSADLRASADRIRQTIRSVDFMAAVLPWLIAACILGSLALSSDRRRTAMVLAVSVIVAMLLELIAIKWARQELLGLVQQPQNLAAVGYIFDTLTAWLRQMTLTVIVAMIILLGLCLTAGPYAWAVTLRQRLHLPPLKQSRPIIAWHSVRRSVYRWRQYIWLTIILLVLVATASLPAVTRQTLAIMLLLVLCLVALVQIIGRPHAGIAPSTKPAHSGAAA